MSTMEDWRRVEELFFRCEQMAEEDRGPFLDEACGSDLALRRRVQRLLAADDSVGDRIEQIVHRAAMAETAAAGSISADLGSETATPEGADLESLGPFRLLEVLGEGGMGTVYLGERADGVFRQRVAIKVVKQGLFGRWVERRFERERQILAQLEHPAIARLIDGGTTPDGSPYLVMELVDGEPIDRYCDGNRLSVSQRLDLFREVCSGVLAAHRNLVVHRDLKPSNILVDTEGRPKLLDFGISKLLENDEASAGTAVTLLGQRLLTPEYASPEQVRDEPITTAVDVYALGLLLHRLLTGDRPYPLPTTRGEELRRAICDVPAERPSATVARLAADSRSRTESLARDRGTVPGRLRRLLVGDLDHIVSKALRKEPGERYDSVESLSADVARHQEGQPVEARRGDFRYRAGRFLRRNRTAVGAAAAVVLALSLGLVGQAREAERANREAERANLKARDSAAIADFLTELFDASDPMLTRDEATARELLDRGVERIQVELVDQPLTRAHVMRTLGRVYHNRGLFPEADALFVGALRHRAENLPKGHGDIATSHLDLADNLRVLGRVDEAMPHYEEALALRRALFADDSLELAEALNNMALGLMRTASYDRAEKHLAQVLDIRRRNPGDGYLVAQTLHNLTLIASRKGDYRTAVGRGRETLKLKAEVLAPDHPSTARTLSLLAGPLREIGDYAESERVMRRALDIMLGAWDGDHLDVLATRGDLAFVRHLAGEQEVAEGEQREVLRLKRQNLGEEHREVAISLDALGRQLEDRGDLDEAEELLNKSLELRRRLYPDGHPGLAHGRQALGTFLLRRGRLEEAEPLLTAALEARRGVLRPDHPHVGESLVAYAELLLKRGSPSAAAPLAEDGLSILGRALPADHFLVAWAETVVAGCRSTGASSASAG
ncbi:MAG: serine/threonine-protein kinase [Acidobacteriota bacterium]